MVDLDAIRKIEDWKQLKFNIGFDITSVCNLKCRMCYHLLYQKMGVTQKKEEMELWLFEKILKEFDGRIESLNFSCTAEPFMHPDAIQFLRMLSKYDVPKTNIVTNGILMKENINQVIVEAGIDEVTFSIDGATDKTFKDIRGASLESLLGNIRKLNKIKEKMNSRKPKLIFNMILMKSNIEEMLTLIDLAKEYGVEEVNFQHLVVFKGLDISNESVFWMDHNYANQLMDEALERAEELDIKVMDMPKFPDADLGKKRIISKVKSLFLPEEDFLCIKPWVAVVFTPKGDVLPCFGWFNEECMGNIVENSFGEIWNSERYRKLREEHRGKAKMRMHCKRCSFLSSRRYDESAFEEREVKLV